MDVPHEQVAAVFLGINIRVVPGQPTVSGALVFVLDNRPDLPDVLRVRAALTVIITGLGQVPEVVDDTGGDKPVAILIVIEPPGVAGSLAKKFEIPGDWVKPPK